jgi:hypothetical protein
MPRHLILHDFMGLIIFGEEYQLRHCPSVSHVFQYSVFRPIMYINLKAFKFPFLPFPFFFSVSIQIITYVFVSTKAILGFTQTDLKGLTLRRSQWWSCTVFVYFSFYQEQKLGAYVLT